MPEYGVLTTRSGDIDCLKKPISLNAVPNIVGDILCKYIYIYMLSSIKENNLKESTLYLDLINTETVD